MELLLQPSHAAENERALRALLDSVDGVVFEYDLELDRYVVVRGKREALLGYSQEEWCEPGFWAGHVHPEDVESAHGFCVASIDAQRDHQFEYRMLARDGRAVWMHDHVTLVLREGRPCALRGVMLDVTERRRAERALRASEARNRALLETFPDMLFVVDSEGVFLDCHAPDPRLLSMPAEQFLGRRLSDVLPEPLATPIGELLRDTFATGRSHRSVRAFAAPMGERTFEYRLLPFGDDRALIIARDITEQRRLEDRQFQAQKLESIGRMAGGVAHDFNNLLTGILSYAELGAIEAADGTLGEYFRRIQLAGERAAGLTKQLLAFAREELVEPRVVAPNELVDEMLAFLRRVIGEHVQLETDLASDAWRTRIDPTQFYSVLMNLAVNARDALPSGGEVRIATRNVRLEGEASVLPEGEYVELTVSDGGVGMDEPTRQRVFEPFFTTKGAGRGVGMGLATCYGIVRQNGGAIQISSREGAGTCVQVLLPRVDRSSEARPVHADTPVRGGERVLLVEDDRVVREIAVGALEKLGYRVSCAADGAEALERFLERLDEIDVLVTDVVMPRLGGDALAAKLRERRRDLPVLFISGYAPAGDGESRGSALLRKPFSPADLARKLREVLTASSSRV